MPDDRGGRPEQERSRSDFVSEAEEILETLSDRMRELERVFAAGRPHTEAINTIFREVHSLKGLSSLLGFPEVAAMTHELEDLLSRLRLGGALAGPVLDVLHLSLDALLDALRRVRTGGTPATGLEDIRERLRQAVASIVVPDAPMPPGLELPAGLVAALPEFGGR